MYHNHYIRPGAESSPASSVKLNPRKTEEILVTPPPKAKPNALAASSSASKQKLQRASRLPSVLEASPKSVGKPKALVKKAIAKNKASKTASKKATKTASKKATKAASKKATETAATTSAKDSSLVPYHRIPTKQSPCEGTNDVPDGPETTMSEHIAKALQKLGSGDRSGNKVLVLVEDEETKQKRKNRKNSFYRSLISHLVEFTPDLSRARHLITQSYLHVRRSY